MWFNKKSLKFTLNNYKGILFFRKSFFFNYNYFFWKNNLEINLLKKNKIKFFEKSLMELLDLQNYYKLQKILLYEMIFNYKFFLKHHLFFDFLISNTLSEKFFLERLYFLKYNQNSNFLKLINNLKLKLRLLYLKNTFFNKINFYLKYIFLIDSFFYFVIKYLIEFESFFFFDLYFSINLKFLLFKDLNYKQRINLWDYLGIKHKGSSVFFDGFWLKNKDITLESNLYFIKFLDLKLIFNYWKEFIYNEKNEKHIYLNLLYSKYYLNNNLQGFLHSYLNYIFLKKKYFYKKDNNVNFSKNNELKKNKFLKYLSVNAFEKKLIVKGQRYKDYIYMKSLNNEISKNLDLILYLCFFFYIKKIYKISDKFLYNIEFLYFIKKWTEKKIKLMVGLFIIFLKLIIKFQCKFKRGFYKLIFSIYFFILKKYKKLKYNLLDNVKLNYFNFSWNFFFRNIFLLLYFKNKESDFNVIWNYKLDILNETIYYYYYKYWNYIYNKKISKLRTLEIVLKKKINKKKIMFFDNNFFFLKLFNLYKLGNLSFWSLFYKKKIIDLKIKYIQSYFASNFLKNKKKNYIYLKKNKNFFKFFLIVFIKNNLNNNKFLKKNISKYVYLFFSFDKIFFLYKYYCMLYYIKLKQKKPFINKIRFVNISFFYLMKRFDKNLFRYLKFIISYLFFILLKNKYLFFNSFFFYIFKTSLLKKNFFNKLHYLFFNKIKKKTKINKKNRNLFFLNLKKVSYNKFNINYKLNDKNISNLNFNFIKNVNNNFERFINKKCSNLKNIFLQDSIYFFNDYFVICDKKFDLYLDKQLLNYKNLDMFQTKFLDKNLYNYNWLKQKVNYNNKLNFFYLLKFEIFNKIKEFVLLHNNLEFFNKLNFNNNIHDFMYNIFFMLSTEVKYKFNLDKIMLIQALSYIDNKELLQRNKFNFLFIKKNYIIKCLFFLLEENINLIFEDLNYYFFDFIFDTVLFKEKQNFILEHYSNIINNDTTQYLKLNSLKIFQLHQAFFNLNFFYNIFLCFFNFLFFKLNFFLREINYLILYLNRKNKLILNESINIKNILDIYFYKYLNIVKFFLVLQKKIIISLINNNNNFIFFDSNIEKNVDICKMCNCIKVDNKIYNKIQYFQKNLKNKLNNYKNIYFFSYKFCSFCKHYIVSVGDNILYFFNNNKYFLNDCLVKKNLKNGFAILNNNFIYFIKLPNNKIIFKNLIFCNINLYKTKYWFIYFFFEIFNNVYYIFIDPHKWTKIAYTTICWDISKILKDNNYLITKEQEIYLELNKNKQSMHNVLYKNWLLKRNFWKSLTKEERANLKLKKQTEDLWLIGKKKV